MFITRNDGVLNSSGEYLLFIDSNGLLVEDILKKLYGAIEMHETDIIQFVTFELYNNKVEKNQIDEYIKKEKIISQPDILKLSFYPYKGELFQNNLNLWGKAIKRKKYIQTIQNMKDYYKEQNWNLFEDSAMYFILLKNSENYIFINENGYINEIEDNSNDIRNNTNNSNKIIKDLFLLADIFFEYTEDNLYEKLMAMYQIKRIIKDYKNDLENVNRDFYYYYKVLEKFANCKNIFKEDQCYINDIREILQKIEK